MPGITNTREVRCKTRLHGRFSVPNSSKHSENRKSTSRNQKTRCRILVDLMKNLDFWDHKAKAAVTEYRSGRRHPLGTYKPEDSEIYCYRELLQTTFRFCRWFVTGIAIVNEGKYEIIENGARIVVSVLKMINLNKVWSVKGWGSIPEPYPF